MATVYEVVEKYGLVEFDKTYKDLFGQVIPFANLSKLADAIVKDVYINLVTNEAVITINLIKAREG